jgi:predicted DNA-binding transcriptional regulator AlpA
MRLAEIAELLGVTSQRAHQIVGGEGFPHPTKIIQNGGRMWSRQEVEAWAREWEKARPWRSLHI